MHVFCLASVGQQNNQKYIHISIRKIVITKSIYLHEGQTDLGSKLLKKSRQIRNGKFLKGILESSCDNLTDKPVETRIGEVEDEKRW